MRLKTLRLFPLLLALLLVLPALPAPAETPAPDAGTAAMVIADLRPFAPEGTFLKEGAAPVVTEDGYQSEHISITITRTRDQESRSNVTVADVHVASVEYLRRGFPLGKWDGEMRSIKTIAPESGAILAMTGDYASLLDSGLVVANGEVLRKTPNGVRDNCLVLRDGRMVTYPRREMEIGSALELGVWHSFLFGPALLADGEVIPEFDSKIKGTNPRSALGFIAPGHYVFVLVDGR
ncbi:MAG TPA: phosphodiester glycosidase family protein, partial [Candidatus Limnocylindria bacterium]|nr:phosphodiester glycosidase family protein [Candidatus Limnocylindria bacterium]